MVSIENQLAAELKVRPEQVKSAVALLDGGATVPFIARYRKEATGNLDDIQLRELETRLTYLREMQARREAIVQSITEQGKMTPALQQALLLAATKQELEDFVDSLQQKDMEKFKEFFDTMPEIKKDVHFKCPKCAYEEDITIKGMQNFFV